MKIAQWDDIPFTKVFITRQSPWLNWKVWTQCPIYLFVHPYATCKLYRTVSIIGGFLWDKLIFNWNTLMKFNITNKINLNRSCSLMQWLKAAWKNWPTIMWNKFFRCFMYWNTKIPLSLRARTMLSEPLSFGFGS